MSSIVPFPKRPLSRRDIIALSALVEGLESALTAKSGGSSARGRAQSTWQDDTDLFVYYGIVTFQHTRLSKYRGTVRSSKESYCRYTIKSHTLVIIGKSQLPCPQSALQMPKSQTKIVRLVTSTAAPYLNYGVYATFKGHPKDVANAALKLEDNKIYLLGQLVQMTEDQLLGYRFITPDIIAQMREHLERMDCTFGMRAPGWGRGLGLGLD